MDFVCHALAYHCEKGKGGGEGIEARALEQEEIQQRLRKGEKGRKWDKWTEQEERREGIQKKTKKEGCKTLCKTKETKNKMQVCKRGPKSDFSSDTFQRVLVREKGKGDLPPPAFFSFRTLFRRLKGGKREGGGKGFFPICLRGASSSPFPLSPLGGDGARMRRDGGGGEGEEGKGILCERPSDPSPSPLPLPPTKTKRRKGKEWEGVDTQAMIFPLLRWAPHQKTAFAISFRFAKVPRRIRSFFVTRGTERKGG